VHVFIRHLHPYGGFQSSAAVSSALKKYITYAGLTRKNRKAIHSLRRTLASTLLMDGTPLLTISNILGHSSPKTTTGYTKVNLPALRKCALSYGKWEASA
jgi:site-specific recombinase XerD